MKHLLELKNVITKNKIKNLKVLDGSKVRRENTLLHKFYNALVAGKITEDEEAKKLLYGEGNSDEKYKQLKGALKERLMNTVLFVDKEAESGTERARAQATCYRNLAVMNILSLFGAHQTRLYLAKKILREAEKYELMLPAIEVLMYLCKYNSIYLGDYEEFVSYQDALLEKLNILNVEVTLRNNYYDLMVHYVNNKSNYKKVVDQAKNQKQFIQDLLLEANSEDAIYYGNLSLLIALSDAKDVNKRVALCKEVLKQLNKKGFVHSPYHFIFFANMSLSYIEMRKYSVAKKNLEKTLTYTLEASFNWFKAKELYFLLYMQTAQYEEGEKVVEEVFAQSKLKKMSSNVQEQWRINRAYVFLLKEVGLLEKGKKYKPFNVSKFFNEVPTFSKDKRGVNVPILVIQVMFWLSRGDRDRLIDRVESLKQYTYKYLRDPYLKRSHLFLKMLCVVSTVGFDPDQVRKRVRKWHEELISTPANLVSQPFEMEIIPYERMWEMVMKLLEEKAGKW